VQQEINGDGGGNRTADLEQCNIQERLPVMQLLVDLAKVELFPPLNMAAMAVVAQMMSSCSNTHRIRAMGVQIIHELSQVRATARW
jgi:hypothetical protein